MKFEKYRTELADIRKENDIPPPKKKHEYRYHPVPADIIPPVGENHMMHVYNNPDEADETATCLNNAPKKFA